MHKTSNRHYKNRQLIPAISRMHIKFTQVAHDPKVGNHWLQL